MNETKEALDPELFTGKVLNIAEKKPWFNFYEDVPHTLDYPECSLYERLMQSVEQYPDNIAWEFAVSTLPTMSATYKEFGVMVNKFADALAGEGFKKGDIMTISMPTSPQGIIAVYAVNKLGGIASMIHPLSPPAQIEMYLNLSQSNWGLTMDAFYQPFIEGMKGTKVKKVILAKLGDYLPAMSKFLFWLAKGRKIPKVPQDDRVIWFNKMMKGDYPEAKMADVDTNDTAVILYSGGTTGVPKGIELTNRNMITEGMQVSAWGDIVPGNSLLAIMPIFHGFGLGVCVNAAFMNGGKSILIPQFTPESVAALINKKKPNFVVGVPTLFEALASNQKFQNADLSCLTATFCGADTLPKQTKEKFERVVKEGGGEVQLLEGYGLTEAVTAIMATPMNKYREGSIGVPFPDMLAKIVKLGTTEEASCGEEGEIVVSGPAVMKGYLNNPEANAKTLQKHEDGRTWLHTGDVGRMDKDGWFYFSLRQKRMLKVSGINVYPKHVEEILRQMPEIEDVCIIGIPDQKQITRVKAVVILTDPSQKTEEMKEKIKKYGISKLLKYESPREVEFVDELPLTLVGKVAWKKLEDTEMKKLEAAGKYPFNE